MYFESIAPNNVCMFKYRRQIIENILVLFIKNSRINLEMKKKVFLLLSLTQIITTSFKIILV